MSTSRKSDTLTGKRTTMPTGEAYIMHMAGSWLQVRRSRPGPLTCFGWIAEWIAYISEDLILGLQLPLLVCMNWNFFFKSWLLFRFQQSDGSVRWLFPHSYGHLHSSPFRIGANARALLNYRYVFGASSDPTPSQWCLLLVTHLNRWEAWASFSVCQWFLLL
jgi:hypothetical protein